MEKPHKYSYVTGDQFYPVGTAEVTEHFPFDLGFSMTVHKAQGHTIHLVIIDLTSHPTFVSQMEFAAIFVAMSLVKHTDHIRLLTHRHPGIKFDPMKAYSYLTELKPSHHVMAFYNGFQLTPTSAITGQKWTPGKALKFSQS